MVRSVAREGVAILDVWRRLEEILDDCARVTAFRDGRRVLDAVRERFTRQQLVEAIVGGAAPAATATLDRVVDTSDVLLEGERLARGKAERDVNLASRRCAVLGFAGSGGSGRSVSSPMV